MLLCSQARRGVATITAITKTVTALCFAGARTPRVLPIMDRHASR
jgi:hypothetical protein